MKKKLLVGLLCIIIGISAISIITTFTVFFDYHSPKKFISSSSIIPDFKDMAFDIIESEVVEEVPLTMANVSSVVLSNKGVEEDVNTKRAGLFKFFYIPIEPGAVINITNNSDEFKYSVICLSDSLIYDYLCSDWVYPGTTISYTPDKNQKYISLNFARVDDQDVDISSIDLSDFIITYSDDSTNLLDSLLPMAETYESAKLQEYDYNLLLDLSKLYTVAHACGTDINELQLTMESLKNAVEVDGFKIVEIDVRETIDNVLIGYHDPTIANTRTSVRYSTFDALKNIKPDIASLEEILNYCGENNIGVVLDVKDIHSLTAVSNMFSLIEKNNLKKNFFFAACPPFLLNNMPIEYENVSYSIYTGWDDSYNGQNNVRCSYRCGYRIELNKISDLLKKGHKAFELFDTDKTVSSKDLFKQDLSVFMYLCLTFDAGYNLTLYNNISVPVLTEKEILSALPKDVWESLELIIYDQQ